MPTEEVDLKKGLGEQMAHEREADVERTIVFSDGVVAYESAHIEGVESELVVRSEHSVQGHPRAIEEVRRILALHEAELRRTGDACRPEKGTNP